MNNRSDAEAKIVTSSIDFWSNNLNPNSFTNEGSGDHRRRCLGSRSSRLVDDDDDDDNNIDDDDDNDNYDDNDNNVDSIKNKVKTQLLKVAFTPST